MNHMLPIDALQDIWHFATRKHDGQKYGGAEQGEQIEYLNHIAGVTFEIINASIAGNGMDIDLALKCAVLHDTIEDTDTTYDEIARTFGTNVADGVLALTKDSLIEGKREKMLDSLRRIKAQPTEVWAVKMADRIVNLYLPPYYWSTEKKQAYVDEARLIYEHLHEGNQYLAGRLAMKIAAYNKFIN
jgi:(p)ppGpp synthase/HD superfamily hydrolase